MTRVGEHYAACRWSTERPAKQAFESFRRDPKGASMWRAATPARPPHDYWACYVIGEDARVIAEHLADMQERGGERFEPEADFLEALRARRVAQWAESGGRGGTFFNLGMRARMDKQGRLHQEDDDG